MTQVDLAPLERHWNCRLTARGRKSGEPRTVTIWFALGDGKVFLTGAAVEPNWVKNLRANPDATVQIGRMRLRGRARVVDDPAEAESVRKRFVRRYLMARLSRLVGTGYTDSTAVVIEGLEAVH